MLIMLVPPNSWMPFVPTPSSSQLSLATWNTRRCAPKFWFAFSVVQELSNVHMIALQDVSLHATDDLLLLFPSHHVLCHSASPQLLFLVHDSIWPVCHLAADRYQSSTTLVVEASGVCLVNTYLHPSSSTETIQQYSLLLSNLLAEHSYVGVVGDLNARMAFNAADAHKNGQGNLIAHVTQQLHLSLVPHSVPAPTFHGAFGSSIVDYIALSRLLIDLPHSK